MTSRRRVAQLALFFLVLLHALAFGAFFLRAHQLAESQVFLDARDQWRAGHLQLAAAEYRHFLAHYHATIQPLLLAGSFPSEASAYFALGRVETDLNHVDAALNAFDRAGRLEHGLGHRESRELLLQSGRFQQLISLSKQQLTLEPDSLPATADLAAALLLSGSAHAAAEQYQRAIALVPAFLRRYDPLWNGPLSVQEAEFLNLAAVAELRAGDASSSAATCASINTRAPAGIHLDHLCQAYLAHARHDDTATLAALKGFLPQTAEQKALVQSLGVTTVTDKEPVNFLEQSGRGRLH